MVLDQTGTDLVRKIILHRASCVGFHSLDSITVEQFRSSVFTPGAKVASHTICFELEGAACTWQV